MAQYEHIAPKNHKIFSKRLSKKLKKTFGFSSASEEVKANKEVVLKMLKINTDGLYVLRYTSEALRVDREVVMAVVRRNSEALEYASDNLKDDKDVISAEAKKMTGLFNM